MRPRAELIAFSDRIAEFTELNTNVLAASVDSKYSHLQWIKTPRKDGGLGTMNIPLIADIEKRIARDYGVLLEAGADAGVALRGLFIIDPKGVIRQVRRPSAVGTCISLTAFRMCWLPDDDQRPARGPVRRRDAAPRQGLPICGQPRRGVPCELGARCQDNQGEPERVQRVLPERQLKRVCGCGRRLHLSGICLDLAPIALSHKKRSSPRLRAASKAANPKRGDKLVQNHSDQLKKPVSQLQPTSERKTSLPRGTGPRDQRDRASRSSTQPSPERTSSTAARTRTATTAATQPCACSCLLRQAAQEGRACV